jgi:hypothetical protein
MVTVLPRSPVTAVAFSKRVGSRCQERASTGASAHVMRLTIRSL